MKILLLRTKKDKSPLLAWAVRDELTKDEIRELLKQAKEQGENPVKLLDKTFTPVGLLVVDT